MGASLLALAKSIYYYCNAFTFLLIGFTRNGTRNVLFTRLRISFETREDKGDREGLPHTHTIPQVITGFASYF